MDSTSISEVKRYESLLSISDRKTNGEFKLKIMKKWYVKDAVKNGGIVSVEMILADQTGHKIQASIPKILFSMFDKKIIEGKIYIMSNFTVKSNVGDLLGSYHRNLLIFSSKTQVKRTWGYGFPEHGVTLIGSTDILSLKEKFKYLIDVIGVLTYVRHDKNIFPDGTTANTVTLKLTDNRDSFECELSGGYVNLFREMMKDIGLGLPVIVMQWVKVATNQGRNVVKSVDGRTKLYVNPTFYEAAQFRKGLVPKLNSKRKTLGVPRTDKPIGFNFTTHYHCKSISQLKEDPTLGIYLVNARLMDVAALDTWWYPVCGCGLIVEDYLGAFFCGKCYATDFHPMLKFRVKLVIDDESGSTFVESFDHVMLPIATVDPRNPDIAAKYFHRAFESVQGKSIIFIIEKKRHEVEYHDGMFEVLCVSDDPAIIKYYVDKGVCSTPSKEVDKIMDEEGNLMRPIVYESPVTTTKDLLVEYLHTNSAISQLWEAGESSAAAAARTNEENSDPRSVRPRLA
ncbi:replication protein A 70 kDa DNA-binding subunit C [Trifolium repens]|nr:replication protein A 70 kDa DNA-binding subunit C [Trifolium repens]